MRMGSAKIKYYIMAAVAVILSLCIVIIFIGQTKDEKTVTSVKRPEFEISREKDEYKLISQNGNLSLYVNQYNGYFYVLNRHNNSVWYSVPENYKDDKISKGLIKTDIRSHFTLEYIATEDINTKNSSQKTNSQVGCVAQQGIYVEKQENGVRVYYDFKELDIVIPVNYILHNDYLEATIDVANIYEGDSNRIIEAQFLPYFGATDKNSNGYLFVPDGCGAVAGFNRNIDSYKDYKKMVYGYDKAIVSETTSAKEETIKMPVFGTVIEGKGAMMGIIAEGEGAASVFAKTASAKTNYNSISSLLAYRIFSREKGLYSSNGKGDKTISSLTNTLYGLDSYTVRYYFLDNDDASYVGMAKKYREYLIEEKGLKKNPSKPSLALNVYGSLETTANFLGVKYNKKRLLTRFSETQELIDDLYSNGVENLSLKYIGWNNNGVYNRKFPSSANPLSILGGKKSFKSLCNYLNKNNLEYYFAVDFLNYSKSSLDVSRKKNSAHTTNGDVAKQYEYSVVTNELNEDINSWVLLRPDNLLSKSKKFMKDFSSYNIKSVALNSVGDMIYSDFDDKKGVYRSKSVDYFREFLSLNSDKKIAIDGGNSYAVPYVSRIYELPISSSEFDIFDYDVPFIQIVLHGYVNYTTPAVVQSYDPYSTFLKSLEYGSDLLYECVGDKAYNLRETRLSSLYSSRYSLWKEQAVEYYKKQKDVFDLIWDKEIVNHRCVGDNSFKTEYANGAVVYVNYSDVLQFIDGNSVDAHNYKLVKPIKGVKQ